MKITLVTNIFPPEIGGPATYASEILKRFNDRECQVKVVTLSEGVEATTDVYVVPRHKLKIIGFVHTHIALLRGITKVSKGCDVIYTLSPSFTGLASLIAARLLRKPVVLRFVGDAAWETASNTRQTNKNLEDFLRLPEGDRTIKWLIAVQKFVLNSVNKVIVPSRFLKGILIEYYKVRSEKIKVIYNSIDLEDYQKIPFRPFQRSTKLTMVTVGRLVRHKRIDKIIEAISVIRVKYPNVELLIIGEGPEKENLENLTRELGIESNVNFYGSVDHSKILDLIQNADMLVLNSIYEGLPHVVIEAMACGTPVIATNIKGTNEVVEDGETGLLVSPDNDKELKDKIILLLKNKELRKRLVENAYKNVMGKFTWEKNLSMLEKELEGII